MIDEKVLLSYVNKKIAIHKELSEQVIGSNEHHIGAIKELERLKIKLVELIRMFD